MSDLSELSDAIHNAAEERRAIQAQQREKFKQLINDISYLEIPNVEGELYYIYTTIKHLAVLARMTRSRIRKENREQKLKLFTPPD